jgi:DNA-binding transcriptional MerR regulator
MPRWRPLVDAACEFELHPRTLQRWAKQGLIRTYRVMGDRRAWVDLDEIEKLREPQPKPPRDHEAKE